MSDLDGDYADDGDALSDADSDYLDLQDNIAKLKDTVRKFRHEQRGESSDDDEEPSAFGSFGKAGGQRGRGRRGRVFRGPRKAAEPTGDIRARLGRASQAFILENYEEAKTLVEEVIRINAETHEAWTLLASIFRELGDTEKTLLALIYAAHLRPKDAAQWLNAARFALEETGDQRTKNLPSAKFCFSSAIRANPKDDLEARCGKAAVLRELGSSNAAIAEYKHVLKQKPYDTSVLRMAAEAYIDVDKVKPAQDLYKNAIAHYKELGGEPGTEFTWSDANIYLELYAYAGQYAEAINELRSLARWLLGRESEMYWDSFLEDDREWDSSDERRSLTPEYIAGQYSLAQYGDGLPLEFRIKLGQYRLKLGHEAEALAHLRWLDPTNDTGEDRVLDYPDLYRDAADSLQQAGLYEDALEYYESLKKVAPIPGDEALFHLQIGKCHLKLQKHREAEECFQTAITYDQDNIEARVQLAKLYEEIDEQEQAFVYVNELIKLRRAQNRRKKKEREEEDVDQPVDNDALMLAAVRRRNAYRSKRLMNLEERRKQEAATAERLLEQYSIMRLQRAGMRANEPEATKAWMLAAADMIEDFRGYKTFYSWDKYVRFLGYTGSNEDPNFGATPLDADLAEMATRISSRLGAEVEQNTKPEVPENYRGISFSTWLDIFLDYALCLIREGKQQEAYDICEAAKDATVFYHSKEFMFLIHICWCACALLSNDEETCVAASRYFMKEYQFRTDTYRMFGALNRLCQSPISWYNSGPTQKYILRQIKAMDYSLVSDEARRKYFSEKGSYSAVDENGQPLINTDMDVALLMTYGHILYTGTSYTYALNYFFRAYALDPENPMIQLSIGLGYVHYGMKRQAENRQFHIMQGLTFLRSYYQNRRKSASVAERQEASYNMARTYHMLGLTHLAAPFYEEVLSEARLDGNYEELKIDAAYNLQTIFSMAGNLEMAERITSVWLTI